MGTAKNGISGFGETGNHPPGRAIPSARTLGTLGILPSTFYRWYDRYQAGGPEALEDRSSAPRQVWNRIPDEVRRRIVDLALDAPELSPRELASFSGPRPRHRQQRNGKPVAKKKRFGGPGMLNFLMLHYRLSGNGKLTFGHIAY